MCICLTELTDIRDKTRNHIFYCENKWYFTYENTMESTIGGAFFIVLRSLVVPRVFRAVPIVISKMQNINVERNPSFTDVNYIPKRSISSNESSYSIQKSGDYELQVFTSLDEMICNIDRNVFPLATDILTRIQNVKVDEHTFLILAKKVKSGTQRGAMSFLYEPVNSNVVSKNPLISKTLEFSTMHEHSENLEHSHEDLKNFDLRIYADFRWNGSFVNGKRFSNELLHVPDLHLYFDNIMSDYLHIPKEILYENYSIKENLDNFCEVIQKWNSKAKKENCVYMWKINTNDIINEQNYVAQIRENSLIFDEPLRQILEKYCKDEKNVYYSLEEREITQKLSQFPQKYKNKPEKIYFHNNIVEKVY